MTFDEKLKARAKREGSPMPEGFDERMDALLHDLPEQVTPIKKRRPARTAVCIGVAAALVVGAAAAAPTVLEMARNAISYFAQNGGSEYAAYQGKYEKYNAAVGISDTNGDQTLTIDNLAVDDSYLMIFSTLKSEKPLELRDGKYATLSARVKWTAPNFFAEINGELLDMSGPVEMETRLVDDCTLTSVQRIALKELLPDQFDLLLYDGSTSDIGDANFRFEMLVDKSAVAVETLTVEPKQNFTVAFDYTSANGVTIPIRNTPRIERVSISPFGSTITLSERAADPMTNFVLRDDKGNFLPVISNGSVGSDIGRVTNTFEFLGADLDTQSVTLIPCIGQYRSHAVTGTLDSLPLTDDCKNGLTLETLELGEKQAVATFSIRGAVWEENGQFNLTDAEGNPLSFNKFAPIEYYTDRETGKIISTLYFPDATEAEVAQIAGVSFYQPDDDLELLEDQAVTINLQ